MSEIKEQAAVVALNKMFKDGHFSICVIDKIADMWGIHVRGSEEYRILSTLHCVDYEIMPVELRESLPELIRRCLGRGTEFRWADLDKKVIEVNPITRGIRRLIGNG